MGVEEREALILNISIYKEVEEITENWVKQFNEERPMSRLETSPRWNI
jgi:hypothetical protein